jgi:hypothetical protein
MPLTRRRRQAGRMRKPKFACDARRESLREQRSVSPGSVQEVTSRKLSSRSWRGGGWLCMAPAIDGAVAPASSITEA